MAVLEKGGPAHGGGRTELAVPARDVAEAAMEDRFRSIREKLRFSALLSLLSVVLGLFSLVAKLLPVSEGSLYQIAHDRWVISLVILVPIVTVALTIAFVLQGSRRTRRLTDEVISTYRLALTGSVFDPGAGAKTRG